MGSEKHVYSAIECILAVRGQPRWLISVLIKSAYAPSYQWSIVTLVQSCTISETQQVKGRKLSVSISTYITTKDVPSTVSIFLLLARYVPNVAKRNIWDQCKKYILRTDRRPTTDQRPHIWENSNGDISAADHKIHCVLGSRMGFSGSADWMALITVWPISMGICGRKQWARSN